MEKTKLQPLSGIKIVELGTNLAIPTATRVLADWGAEVIKIEGLKGDPWRNIGIQNYKCPITPEENPCFAIPNANKKFVALDLKNPDGIKAMLNIIKDADVFVSNVRESGLKRLGLGYEDIKKINPEIIYSHFSGYGPKGPEAPRPGYDLTSFWAKSGALVDWTDEGGYPMKPSGGFGDFITGMSIASGILAAVIGKIQTGKGTRMDSSLYGASIWYNAINVVSAQERYGNHFPKSKLKPHNPFSGIFKGSDGEWVIITINQYNQYYKQVCTMLEMTDLIDDEIYCDVKNLNNDEKVMEFFMQRMFDAFEKKSSKEWFEIFQKNDLPCEILVHHKDVSEDVQAIENGYVREVEFNNGNKAIMPTTPVQFSQYDTSNYETYSRIGSDTKSVLMKLGYTEEEIEDFAAKNACII